MLTIRNCIMPKYIIIVLPLLLGNALRAQTATPAAQYSLSRPPLIILIGPPLSGKTTLVDSITQTYNIPNISVEDLIKDHANELEHLRGQGMSMAEMRYDPAMSRYLRERLKPATSVMVSRSTAIPRRWCRRRTSPRWLRI
jgi:hypothetical protein